MRSLLLIIALVTTWTPDAVAGGAHRQSRDLSRKTSIGKTSGAGGPSRLSRTALATKIVNRKALTLTRSATRQSRDALSNRIFNGKTKTVFEDVTKEWLRAHLGEEVANLDFGKFVGAPDGARISVWKYGENGIVIGTDHPWYKGGDGKPQSQIRDLFREKDGSFRMVGRGFCVAADAPEGLATRVHARQIVEARKLGVTTIFTEAARTGGYAMNGYYTWPRLGYDRTFTKAEHAKLPRELASAKTILELMALPGGREWWKSNGFNVGVTFDVHPNSPSSRALDRYLEENGVQIGN